MADVINEWKDVSLSKVLKVMLKDYDKYCCIFSYVNAQIMLELKMYSFNGKSFYLDL